ncbi:MAG: ComF family protein [Leptolyngbya sp. PLA3]|nr:MAG: ComF family protein [Cyanobacteria bacterium CYA]MCE7967226.1 ComF family protein [Leptolyngbya sp. PL-A3]
MSDEAIDRGFVWPPRRAEESAPAQRVRTARVGLLDVIETQFLGRVGLCFDERARLEGWEPDGAEAYCWRCGGSVGPHEADGEGCASCRTKRLPWERAVRLGAYAGPVRDAVLDVKFRRWRQTGRQLGRALGERLRQEFGRAQIEPANVAIVPVPMHWTRRLRMGVDHTQVIAGAAARACGARAVRALVRGRGPSQLEVPAGERKFNVAKVFHRKRWVFLGDWDLIVLVDDVRTTGATLRATSRALRRAGDVRRLWVATAGVRVERGRGARNEAEEGGRSVAIAREIVEEGSGGD